MILSSLIGWDIRFKVASGAPASKGDLPWGRRVFIARVRAARGRGGVRDGGLTLTVDPCRRKCLRRDGMLRGREREIYADQEL